MKSKIFAIILTIVCSTGTALAQSTLSPYTLFGIGEVDSGNHGENSGMAGLGIGYAKENTINTANPASLVTIWSKTFVFDVVVSGKSAWYTGQGRKELVGTGNFDRLAIGFRPSKYWVVSAGVAPVSSVGYEFRTYTQVEGGDERIENSFAGSGGLSKVYISMGISLTRNLSLGMTGSVVWGSTTHSESSPYWTTERESSSSGRPYFDFGLQYYGKINERWRLTVGAVAGYRTELSFHNTSVTADSDGYVIRDKVLTTTRQTLPHFYGTGISFVSRRMTIGADYLFQGWSGIESGSTIVRYKNMNKLVFGFNYTPNLYDARKYMRTVTYLAGVAINDSYMKVSGRSGWNYAFTYGMNFPIRNTNSIYFGLEYGRNAFPIESRNSVRENYFKLSLGFSFKEAWFLRPKFD